MKIGIVGSGITGAVIGSLIPEAVVFERATHVGGRSSTRFTKDTEYFDIGATVFKDKIKYFEKGEQCEFDFLQFLKEKAPDLNISAHKTYPSSLHPSSYMQDLSQKLLSKNRVELLHQAEILTKKPDELQWLLKFTSGKTELFDKIILAAPVPQIISLLKNSGIMNQWDDMIRFRGEYRSALVLTGIWRNLPPEIINKIKALKNYTYLFKDEEAEYISIESEKYRKNESDNTLIITIQFSTAFSSKNLERWCDSDRKPMYYILNSNQYFFNRIFHLLEIPELISQKPDHMDTHKWRYSQADFALFKDTEINLDHAKFKEYLSLCKKNNIWITGDWIWGSRLIRCAFGSTVIAREVLSS